MDGEKRGRIARSELDAPSLKSVNTDHYISDHITAGAPKLEMLNFAVLNGQT